MKLFKVMALAAVAFVSASVANAQEIGDSHSRVYAGYNGFDVFGEGDNFMNGFLVGYEYDFNCSGRQTTPLFLTGGLEYTMNSREDITTHTLAVPVNLKYVFGTEKFAVAPYVGQSFRFGLSSDFYDLLETNRFQIMLNAGLNLEFGKWDIGYRFQLAEIKMFDGGKSDYTQGIMLGYKF